MSLPENPHSRDVPSLRKGLFESRNLQIIAALLSASIFGIIGCKDHKDRSLPPDQSGTASMTSSRTPREFIELPAGTPVRVSFFGGVDYGTSIFFGARLELDTNHLPPNAGVLGQLFWVDGGSQKTVTIFLTHDAPIRVFPPFSADPGTPRQLQIRSLAPGEGIISDIPGVSSYYLLEILSSYGQAPVGSQDFTPKADPARPWNTPASGTDIRFLFFGAKQDGKGVISGLQMHLDGRGQLQKKDHPLVRAIIRWIDPGGIPRTMKIDIDRTFGVVLAPFHPDASGCTIQMLDAITGQEIFPSFPFLPLSQPAFGITY